MLCVFYVDIETEWNLKVVAATTGLICGIVDIETEWNLKGSGYI